MSPFAVEADESTETRIKVFGVGGGGTNAVDYILSSETPSVEFCVINTDARALERSACTKRIQIGEDLTKGLGAGGDPELGSKSAEAAKAELAAALENTDMLFIAAGLGGGTGTGAAPVLARIAHEMGILVVAIVTTPFRFEGTRRMRKADDGLRRLEECVDALIVASNDRLLEVVGKKATLVDAFAVVNNILAQSVRSIASLTSMSGLINADFNDIRSVMSQKGETVMGVSTAKGENRASEAVKKACASPLLDKVAIDGARGVLVCLTGGPDLTLFEIDEAMTMVYESIDEDAEVVFGAVIDDAVGDDLLVTLIATGFPKPGEETREEAVVHVTPVIPPPQPEEDLAASPSPQSLKDKISSMIRPATPIDDDDDEGEYELEDEAPPTASEVTGQDEPQEDFIGDDDSLDTPAYLRRRARDDD